MQNCDFEGLSSLYKDILSGGGHLVHPFNYPSGMLVPGSISLVGDPFVVLAGF